MLAMSNSCRIETLKFDDTVGVLLSEETRKKSSDVTETSGSVLSMERRGRSMNIEKTSTPSQDLGKKSKLKGAGCWQYGEEKHFQRDCKHKNDGVCKDKEKDLVYVLGSDESDALNLSLAFSANHGLLIRVPLFMPLLIMKSFKII